MICDPVQCSFGPSWCKRNAGRNVTNLSEVYKAFTTRGNLDDITRTSGFAVALRQGSLVTVALLPTLMEAVGFPQ